MKNFRSIQNNPTMDGIFGMSGDIVYSNAGGKALTMRVLSPWKCAANEGRKYPLILFIQGSGWTSPNVYAEIPQLSWYARNGYVVATVTHRNIWDGFPSPAFLVDVKCALRYLRAHAEEFCIDTERVVAYGTSSGGNTALLLGMTGDDPRYKSDEYSEQSDAVSAVVECFGPTDMFDLYEHFKKTGGDPAFVAKLLNGDPDSEEAKERARAMSPLWIAEDGVDYPPTLILHGDNDPIVPYESQGVRMFERLCAVGCDTEMVRVENAEHEGTFWSGELHGIVLEFIDKHIKK